MIKKAVFLLLSKFFGPRFFEPLFLGVMYLGLIFLVSGCSERESSYKSDPLTENHALPYELRMTLIHDPNAFTQGLVFYKDKIIESTGGDSSWIAELDIVSGKYEKKLLLDKQYFGEGITVFGDKLYQLTWKNNTGFVYDVNTYQKKAEFSYDFDGWGMTHDGRYLIISDGSDKLHYFDPHSLSEVFTKSVKQHKRKASRLNELEFIDGFIYANQWKTNHILKIDTGTFEVVQTLDLSYFVRENERLNPKADVLNGIAYDPLSKDVYITGKLWPRMYVIRFKDGQ